MRKVLFLLFYLFSVYCWSQPNTFRHVFGGDGEDDARAVVNSYDDGFVMAGSTSSFGYGNSDVYILKVDAEGMYRWSNVFGGINVDRGMDIKQTPDSGYVIVGYTNSFNNGDYDVFLIKTDSLGQLQWQKTYGGNDWDFGYSVALTDDGGFVIVGETYSYGKGSSDVYVIKTNGLGDTLWTKTYGSEQEDVAKSVYINHLGNIVICGFTQKETKNALVLEISDSGEIVLEKIYESEHTQVLNSIVEKIDLTGYAALGYQIEKNSENIDYYFINTDENGAIIHEHLYGSTFENDIGYSIVNRTSITFLIGGETNYNFGSNFMIYVIGLNGVGWTSGIHGGAKFETLYDVDIVNDGGYVAVGTTNSYGQGYNDILIVKTNSSAKTDSSDFFTFRDTAEFQITSNDVYQLKNDIKIYPIPAKEEVFFSFNNNSHKALKMDIFDLSGKKLEEIYIQQNQWNYTNQTNTKILVYSIYFENQTVYSGYLIFE
jgi:hypothetical protein